MPNEKILQDVRENCVGYRYGAINDRLYSFGSEKNKTLFPWAYLNSVQPISRPQALLHRIHSYCENRINISSDGHRKKIDAWKTGNLRNIIIYHAPLDLDQLVKQYQEGADWEKRHSEGRSEWRPEFNTAKEYFNAMQQAYADPFLLHHKGFVPPREHNRGYYSIFLIAGDRQYTEQLSELILNHPELIPKIISRLTGEERKYVDETFRTQDNLLLFDTTRKPKKQVKKINWKE